ncbi:MAG: D-2-hydroxyacid dehydrogenase [Anaerolineales bacterium]|nr:D-2-hydroxyacid dehydrogenase [Anaerolineales bacterium]
MSETKDILLTAPFTAEQIEELRKLAPGFRVRSLAGGEAGAAPENAWQQAEILYSTRTLPEPGQAPHLKWIQFHYAGVDAFLDAPILQQEGLRVTSLSGANAPHVAEHALALMLALGRRLPQMLADQSRSHWSPERLTRFVPSELAGSTVGIVGYGAVGQRLARLLQPFGCTLLASRRDLLHLDQAGYQAEGEGDPQGELLKRLYPGKAMRGLLKECDFVVVTVPLTAETRGMLGDKQLAAMKPGAFLVDVSRGGVVEHAALIAALEKGQLAGAGLDVFPEEPLPADSPLWAMPNVIVSPHVAGLSPHYLERAFVLFKKNLRRYLSGEELINQVDMDRGY